MNDWNGNGKYDMSDSFMDYHMANSGSSGASSDWWKWVLLAIIVGVYPPIGIIIFLGILICYSLCLCLHCCPANTFISTISLDSIYMC